MKIEIFSTPNCRYCNDAKAFFRSNELAFEEYDVSASPERKAEMTTATGKLGVPQIRIDGNWYVGYNEKRLREILDLST